MAETRGVFTLDRLRTRVKKGTWVTPDQAFFAGITESPNVGYFAGGQNPVFTPAILSSVDKTNFDTDTTAASPSSTLTVNHQSLGSFSSISAGYFGGGGNPSSPGSSSQVQKLSYSSETTSISPGSNLTQARGYPTGCSNTQNGYFIGGYIFPTAYTTAEKLSFSTDTPYFLPTAVFTTARYGGASAGNQSVAYFAGGIGPSGNTYDSLIDKLTYSTDTTARLPDDLTRRRIYPAGVGNADAGFFAGGTSYTGAVPGPTANVSDIDKLTYSNETVSANPSNLSVARAGLGSAGNTTSGYYTGGSPGPKSTTDKITFSTGSVSAVPGASLSAPGRRYHAGASPRSNAFPTTGYVASTQNLKGQGTFNFGYFMGGEPGPSPHSYAQKLDYSTETVGHVNPANLSIPRYQGGQTETKTHGYMGGGLNPPLYYSRMDKTTYASDTTVAVPGGSLTAGRAYVTAAGNQNFGYFAGGSQPSIGPVYTGYDKMTYASDTTAQLPSVFMSSPKGNAGSAAGNQSRGYHGGGNPGPNSIIDRLTYSTETSSRVTTADLSISNYNRGATGNADKGYWAGGVPSVSTVEVLDYSTETRAALPSSPLTQERYSIGATGNSQSGYFGGGTNGTPEYSIVDKINYSNNTISRVPNANLIEAAWGQGGFSSLANGLPQPLPETPTLSTSDIPSSPNTAYFGGGLSPVVSIMDKLNYSTEIMARVPSGNLSAGRALFAATGNSTNGYFGGGYDGGHISIFNKLTYSTDSTANLPGTNLTVARSSLAATSSSTAGYFGGGNNPGLPTNAQSTVDKLSYSDDTLAAVPGAALETGVFYVGAAGNSSAGYWGAGRNPSLSPINVTTMQKITFSTDTSTTIPSGALTAARYGHASSGNSEVGYFMGGYSIGWFPSSRMVSVIDKIAYSTETSSLVPGGTITPRGFMDGTGSSSAGYITGGNTPGPDTTRTEKLTFTTETSVDLPGAQFTQALWGIVATSARANSVSATSNIL